MFCKIEDEIKELKLNLHISHLIPSDLGILVSFTNGVLPIA